MVELFVMKLGHDYYVYIVECRDNSYYIGITNDLDKRIEQHNTGHDPGCYTYDKRPVELKHFEHYTDVNQAISREKQLKGWSRKKKQALFRENWDELKRLSKGSAIRRDPRQCFDRLSMTINNAFIITVKNINKWQR